MKEDLFNKDNKGHLEFWRDVANCPPGTRRECNRVFARYAAAVDDPACCVWREPRDAYPEAKVPLTLHPRHPCGTEAWYDSPIYSQSVLLPVCLDRALLPPGRCREYGHTMTGTGRACGPHCKGNQAVTLSPHCLRSTTRRHGPRGREPGRRRPPELRSRPHPEGNNRAPVWSRSSGVRRLFVRLTEARQTG